MKDANFEGRLEVCISDADVLVKLSINGYLELLNMAFDKVFIGPTVEGEAKKKIGKQGKGVSLFQAKKDGWLEVIDINSLSGLQKQSVKIFYASYEAYLDPGELQAAALAQELDIFLILSDDRNARKQIEELTNSRGLGHWHILSLLIARNLLSFEQAEKIFNTINATRSRPIKIPFTELHNDSIELLKTLGLI